MQSKLALAAIMVCLLLLAPAVSARSMQTCDIRALQRVCRLMEEGPGDPPGVNPPVNDPGVPDPSVPTLPGIPIPDIPNAPTLPGVPPISIPSVPALPPIPGPSGLPDVPDPGIPSAKMLCASLPTSTPVDTGGMIPSVDELDPRAECELNFA